MQPQLIAVLVAVQDGTPKVLTLNCGRRLPAGPLESRHRSLQTGMRLWVEWQTGHKLGHIEQLYTFADTYDPTTPNHPRSILISYLALTRIEGNAENWRSWYQYFPWEDRTGPHSLIKIIHQRLQDWSANAPRHQRIERHQRAAAAFGMDDTPWDDQLVLQRYELLWEAGLIPESPHNTAPDLFIPGTPMEGDHRRILATGMARLRAKIRYRPVIFELMPEIFTLLALQRTVEAVAGQPMHKQNFRRLITQQNLVEETDLLDTDSRGRPARLFRFRREIIGERQAAGSKLPLVKPT